jgi:hypothetical protein
MDGAPDFVRRMARQAVCRVPLAHHISDETAARLNFAVSKECTFHETTIATVAEALPYDVPLFALVSHPLHDQTPEPVSG